MGGLVPCMAQTLVSQENKLNGANLIAFLKRVLELERAELRSSSRRSRSRGWRWPSAERFKGPRDAEALLTTTARLHLDMIDE